MNTMMMVKVHFYINILIYNQVEQKIFKSNSFKISRYPIKILKKYVTKYKYGKYYIIIKRQKTKIRNKRIYYK